MNTLRLLHQVLQQMRPYWHHLAGVFLLGLLATPIALLLPLPLKFVVDSVLGDHPLPGFIAAVVPASLTSPGALLGLAIGLLILITSLNLVQTMATNILQEYAGESMVLDFRSRVFEHVQRLSLAFHDAQGVTYSTYRIQWDAPAIRWLLLDGIVPLVTAVLTFSAIFVVTAHINLKLALVALLVTPILLLLTYLYSQKLRQRWREVSSLENSAFGILQEALGAIRVVSAFGQERHERERFVRQSTDSLAARLRATWIENWLNLLLAMTVALGTAAVLYTGTRDIQASVLTLGELLLIMAYLGQLYGPLQTIGKQVAGQQHQLASIERVFQLLNHPPAVIERPSARPVDRAIGSIVFRDVTFGYDVSAPVLRDLSFDVPAGTRVGVVGATGAGKTTLLNLLIRSYDPNKGRIFLDQVDLRDYKLEDLRRQFAIVLQDPVLFSTSVAENIAYGRLRATKDEIVAAARAANAEEFILQMPTGYDTIVGERGMRLSGGERQRLSLARAFLKDAPILILDEPTSSVDLRTEATIMNAIRRLTQGRTSFMIAHRLTTLESCDLLLRVENGRLASLSSNPKATIEDLRRVAPVSLSAGDV